MKVLFPTSEHASETRFNSPGFTSVHFQSLVFNCTVYSYWPFWVLTTECRTRIRYDQSSMIIDVFSITIAIFAGFLRFARLLNCGMYGDIWDMRIFSLLYCGVFIGIVVCLNLSIYIYLLYLYYMLFSTIYLFCVCHVCFVEGAIFSVYIDLNGKNIFEVSWLCYYYSPQLNTLLFDFWVILLVTGTLVYCFCISQFALRSRLDVLSTTSIKHAYRNYNAFCIP